MKKHIHTIARLLLGATFTFAGANGLALYLGLEPIGPSSLHIPEMQTLVNTWWLFMPVKMVELIAGLSLLTNKKVRLILYCLLPICMAIFMFHLLYDRALMVNGVAEWRFGAYCTFLNHQKERWQRSCKNHLLRSVS